MNEQHREGLKQQLVAAIDVVTFIREYTHPNWSGDEQEKLTCPMAETRHEDKNDSTPSLSMNPATGAFNCFGCGWKGTSIIGYATDVLYGGNFKKTLAVLFSQYVRNTIPLREINKAHDLLIDNASLMHKIASMRGWNEDIIKRLKIGWDHKEKRTVIPIFNLQGYCLDVRLHDTIRRAPLVEGKRIPAKGYSSSRTGDWFPLSPVINPLTATEIWLLEGEPDVIIATQDGINCITLTGGAGVWAGVDHEKLKLFNGKDVVICFDNDKAGQQAARILSERLTAIGIHSLKNVVPPQGKDVTDFFLKHGGSAQTLKQYAAGTDYLVKPTRRNVQVIPLSETSRAEYIGKTIKTSVIISGKADAPQAIPSRLKLSCATSEYCDACPCRNTGEADYFVRADEPESLEWLLTKDFVAQVKHELHLGKSCKLKAEIVEWQNIEQVTLIPSLSISKQSDEGGYSVRRGYYIGHGIESNNNYDITAVPTIHPRTKESVLLIDKAVGTYDSVAQFRLDDVDIQRLRKLFCDPPKKILKDVAAMLAANVTHIYGRPDVHIAVDLVFHSAADFTFGDTRLPKGSMELLIFGDTRCGKGQIAEGLTRFYDLGQVVSGENASFMGLCGGAQKAGDSFQLSWGVIPINHGRLVVVDEFSGLAEDVLGRLSRVRSEGIAEINKGGINTRTRANARLIWIANPLKGREVASYSNGVTAIMDLIGTNEDVARFDLALVVQKGEVDISEINALNHKTIESKYTKEDLRKVVLWAWSRRPEHVVFTRQATEFILRASNELAELYSATIPLVQGENARFKIAKMAAAIAARCFATEDGVFLKVTEEHASLAVAIMRKFYSKPSMGYRQFSAIELGTKTLVEVHLLDDFFKTWDEITKRQLVDGLLTTDRFGVREIQDWCDTDAMVAKKFAGLFVRCQATKQLAQGLYVKKPAFIKYLKKIKRQK